jgi:hypothetical protein
MFEPVLRSRKYFFLFRLSGALNPNYGSCLSAGSSSFRSIFATFGFPFISQIFLLNSMKITFFDLSTVPSFLRGFMHVYPFFVPSHQYSTISKAKSSVAEPEP